MLLAAGADPLIWTPSSVKAELDRVRSVLDAINAETSQAVTDGKMTGVEWNGWRSVYLAGHKFVDTASTLWGSNVATARGYEQEAGKWRALIKSRGATMTAPADLVNPPKPGILDSLTGPSNITLALAVGGVIAAALLISAIKR
jgi:hypothetical protein